jgi:hypothetical protein
MEGSDHCSELVGYVKIKILPTSIPEFLYGNAAYAAVKGIMGAKIDASVAQLKYTSRNHEHMRFYINQHADQSESGRRGNSQNIRLTRFLMVIYR